VIDPTPGQTAYAQPFIAGAFGTGRLRISRDGALLFATMNGGVGIYSLL
jgi:hypothetical protein